MTWFQSERCTAFTDSNSEILCTYSKQPDTIAEIINIAIDLIPFQKILDRN